MNNDSVGVDMLLRESYKYTYHFACMLENK